MDKNNLKSRSAEQHITLTKLSILCLLKTILVKNNLSK